MNYLLIFLTGLTSGGLSCAAIQGGLLMSLLAKAKTSHTQYASVLGFLLGKTFIYSLAGLILGAFGEVFALDPYILIIFQTIAGLYLLFFALNLLNVHPVFRYLVFTSPKFLYRLTKSSSSLNIWFAPIILGIFTIFIPCATTQAMLLSSIGSANPSSGGLMMFIFTLGTIPTFLLISLIFKSVSSAFSRHLSFVTAIILISFSIHTLNGVLIFFDSPISTAKLIGLYQKLQFYEGNQNQSQANSLVSIENGVQSVNICISSSGYTPNYIQVKNNMPVKLTLSSQHNFTCANYFVLKAFNISARMQPSETKVFNFTPHQTGKFSFSCSMGMYSGIIEVI